MTVTKCILLVDRSKEYYAEVRNRQKKEQKERKQNKNDAIPGYNPDSLRIDKETEKEENAISIKT